MSIPDELTDDERRRLAHYVTDVDGPVFALTNLPEVVKGALFARYSRSAKSLRRLLLDEFLPPEEVALGERADTGSAKAEALYDRVLTEYGDDSVAQLGGAHIAVEGASNLLTKILEWGRLASYLEQSTRYIRLDDKPGGRHRYHRPSGLSGALRTRYEKTMDRAFATYSALIPRLVEYIATQVPTSSDEPDPARDRAVRARALDALRGLLPAATEANVGIFASGQAFESLLIRLQAHPLPEARDCGVAMLRELRKVIPAFLTRVDRPDRGVRHAKYLADNEAATAELAQMLLGPPSDRPDGPTVRLIEWDRDGEARVVTHALWPTSGRSLAEVAGAVDAMTPEDRLDVLLAYAGVRDDRRHIPGRAFEATSYVMEVVCDYGAYRDLQRHRMLTLQAQPLTPTLGYDIPGDVVDAGCGDEYTAVQDACAELWREIVETHPTEAPYVVTLAHRIRFTMTLNAREAMHLIELRSQPQGHETYRIVAQQMYYLIRETAGHEVIADLMRFMNRTTPAAGRLAAERRLEERRSR